MKQGWIASRDAERLLECRRAFLLRLINDGLIPSAKLIDKPGDPRHWIMKRSDIIALKEKGFRKYRTPRKRTQIILWNRYFGEVPKGFSVAFRNRDSADQGPDNLCLIALRYKWRLPARGELRRRRKKGTPRMSWSEEKDDLLRTKFATSLTSDLARELGMGKATVTRRARQMRLRKDAKYLRTVKRSRSLPIGTERVKHSTNTVYVKISDTGSYPERWRPKAHIIWEKHHRRPLPTRNVMHKDGNNRNFAPENLVAMSKGETSALVNLRFHSLPAELKNVIVLTTRLKDEAIRQIGFDSADTTSRHPRYRPNTRHQPQRPGRRWSPRMDEILRRDYPRKLRAQVAMSLGVSESALRQRARRLGIQRLPETVLAEARAKARIAGVQSRSANHSATNRLAA